MEEITIRGTRAQRNLMEWSQRVADCRSSGLSVTRWCAEHGIKPKTYYNWQKKVFAAMLAQQQSELSDHKASIISMLTPPHNPKRGPGPENSEPKPHLVFSCACSDCFVHTNAKHRKNKSLAFSAKTDIINFG